METKPSFKIRFVQVDEMDRLSELVRDLQIYQKMKKCPRLPTGEDFTKELAHMSSSGKHIPNNFGTYSAVAIDTSKVPDQKNSHIVGYMIYTQSYSIIIGRHFYINSFFIEEQYRRCGMGTKFIKFLKLHGQLLGIDGFDVPFMNDNLTGQKFYKRLGAMLVNEDYNLMSMNLLV